MCSWSGSDFVLFFFSFFLIVICARFIIIIFNFVLVSCFESSEFSVSVSWMVCYAHQSAHQTAASWKWEKFTINNNKTFFEKITNYHRAATSSNRKQKKSEARKERKLKKLRAISKWIVWESVCPCVCVCARVLAVVHWWTQHAIEKGADTIHTNVSRTPAMGKRSSKKRIYI